MKTLKKVLITMTLTAIMFASLLCSAQNVTTPALESQTPFTVRTIQFQEWYAGIQIGATGFNVYIPVVNETQNVTIDRIYFRNLVGKLDKQENQYVAVLKNTHSQYTFKKSKRPANYPFNLLDNECVISYLEDGTRKYHKIKRLNEVVGTYYKDGPPSLYLKQSKSSMANLDMDEDN